MKIAIVGSRDYTDYNNFTNKLEDIVGWHFDGTLGEYDKELRIISGGARGVDSLAEQWADENDVLCDVIKPEWEKYGKAAGFIRNSKIVEQCDEVIAFWDGVSRGTEDTIKKAVRLGKQVTIFSTKEKVKC